jgi:catechol 2,3-dioxygenase-like lactoylglutathione lyase family enzyme
VKIPIRESEAVQTLQICFVTDDLEKSLAWFCDLIGQSVLPPINAEPPVEISQPHYLNAHGNITFRQAELTWDGVRIEFIEPGPEPSTWREFLERRGPGVHHLGFDVKHFDETGAELVRRGYPELQSGKFPGGRYAYHDTERELGIMVELLDFDASRVFTLAGPGDESVPDTTSLTTQTGNA